MKSSTNFYLILFTNIDIEVVKVAVNDLLMMPIAYYDQYISHNYQKFWLI